MNEFKKETIEQNLRYAQHTIKYEKSRIKDWTQRLNPLTGRNFEWEEALRAVVENTPGFDEMWDEQFE